MTDKEKLEAIKAEIERMNKEAYGVEYGWAVKCETLCRIQSYMNSLPKEPVSEDLEVEVMEYSNTHNDECFDAIGDKCQFVINAFKAGAQWQKNKMMEDATDVTVHIDAGGYPYIPQIELYNYDKDVPLAKEWDKYKVVLIKENKDE